MTKVLSAGQAFCARIAVELGLFNCIAEADQTTISIRELATFSGAVELLISRLSFSIHTLNVVNTTESSYHAGEAGVSRITPN